MIDPRDLIYVPLDDLTDELTVELASGVYPDSGQPLKTSLGDLADFILDGGGSQVGSITGTFTADGSISAPVPSGAMVIGGMLVPGNATAATVSLGTTSGGSDVLGGTVITGTPSPGYPFLAPFLFAGNQTIFAHSASWSGASVTVTIWFLIPAAAPGTGLYNAGGLLGTTDQTWPANSGGAPGSVYSNGGVASVVPGYSPISGAPVFFGQITSAQLLALGAATLPVTQPTPGSLQLWVLNNEILVA
jgi:hypothetical protein